MVATMNRNSISLRIPEYATLYVRIALAAAFLTSVSDRLGVWGSYGTANVAWGDMTHFMIYTAKLNPRALRHHAVASK